MQPEFVLLPRLLSLHIVAPWRRQGAQLYSPFLVTHTNHIETGEKGRLHAVSTGICEFWQTKKTGRPKWKATTFLYVDCSPLYSQTIIVLNFPWKKINIRSARKSWAFGWEGGKFTTIDCTNGYQGNLGNMYGINLFCVYIATIFE